MANTLTIAEAEAAYAAALAEAKDQAERKSAKERAIGFGLLLLGAVGLILAIATANSLFGFAMMATLGAGFLTLIFSTENLPAMPWAESKQLRLAQKSWVEDHGFEFPQGSFNKIGFPDFLDAGAPQNYGVAQLIDTCTNSLVSVVLRSSPEQGYQLFNTDGQALRSTVEVS